MNENEELMDHEGDLTEADELLRQRDDKDEDVMEERINEEGNDKEPVALCDNMTPDMYSKTVILQGSKF